MNNEKIETVKMVEHKSEYGFQSNWRNRNDSRDPCKDTKSKVGDCSRGQPEGSLFDSYYTKV